MTKASQKNDFIQQIAQLNMAITTYVTTALEPYDVNATNYFYLMKIGDHPGIGQRDFAKLINLNPSSITRAVNQLIKKGLVDKQINTEDKRTSQLYLTREGKKITKQVKRFVNSYNAKLMASITTDANEFLDQVVQLRIQIERTL
ncbi:hypothetical protein FD04_GL002030 [Secundilactobacillus odoratitofui DSM 19909 = JCM 15043]|uniref:HTH marR-type domain-containing protein n=1 Tax=Secundilactobacillus odoratitofui DSM 19909 = JCM 15043 TaxID=1423776 RepID=A0A0R1LNL8_9LACO|nr:MarR family transcriptional regulator [Secundilactobacillus odoratitofui]KRK97168.1 hypothetical protein FD04_GL002030 [Secundilactobacillus odoratitofui DSM 19909 = JCM 15043]